MRKLAKKADSKLFVVIPAFPTDPGNGGLESRRIIKTLDDLGKVLDAQANQLDDWREIAIKFLRRPLVDEDDGLEIIGDEYEVSTQTQDEVIAYCIALKAVIADRHEFLTGQPNRLVNHEMEATEALAMNGDGPSPEKLLELLKIRKHFGDNRPKDLFVRQCIAELRILVASLRPDAENGKVRAQNELAIVEEQLKATQKLLSEQSNSLRAVENELGLLTRVINARLEYYKQLQQVSDTVAPYEGRPNNVDILLATSLRDEARLANKVTQAKTKRRYLEHLKTEAANPQEQRKCVICIEPFETGSLTICGHQYCKDCFKTWHNSKFHITNLDSHNTYPTTRESQLSYLQKNIISK